MLLEREEGRERNIDQLPPVHSPTEFEPTTWVCALTGNQTHNLSVMGRCSNQLRHMGQGRKYFFKEKEMTTEF